MLTQSCLVAHIKEKNIEGTIGRYIILHATQNWLLPPSPFSSIIQKQINRAMLPSLAMDTNVLSRRERLMPIMIDRVKPLAYDGASGGGSAGLLIRVRRQLTVPTVVV